MTKTPNLGCETTPKEISTAILEFCQEIVPGQQPQYVKVAPARFARHLECHTNVAEMTRRGGGEQVFGWIIWEATGQFLGCDFHSVWRSPVGDLEDITPQMDGESKVLFLPDPSRRWEGRVVIGPYRLLTDDPQIASGWRLAREMKERQTRLLNACREAATSVPPSLNLSAKRTARRLAEKTPKQRAEERRRRRKKMG